MEIVPLEMSKVSIGGVHFGRPCRILIRDAADQRFLLHVPGGTHWSGMSGNLYTKASVCYVQDVGQRNSLTYESCPANDLPRYGPKLYFHAAVAGLARKHFGGAAWQQWAPRKTVIV